MPQATSEHIASHLRTLRIASIAAWLCTVFLLYASSLLPLFDSSPRVVLPEQSLSTRLVSPLLRWDAFHFLHIAQNGYTYEQNWAFLPGIAHIMTFPARFLEYTGLTDASNESLSAASLLGSASMLSIFCGTTELLYRLTLLHFKSPSLAYLTALLSLLSSSPAISRFSAYNEPFFTYLSYRGMLSCATHDIWKATGFFVAAAWLRSNGFMLAGFVVWDAIFRPLLGNKRVSTAHIMQAVLSTLCICAPFAIHQYTAYRAFCMHGEHPSWCSYRVPSIYGYVQDRYWNVGFLRYWTPAQLPNILLAAPILISIFSFSFSHLRASTLPALLRHPLISAHPVALRLHAVCMPNKSIFWQESIIPHILHSLVMCSILLFAAHTQITLRLAASMPTTFWAAAHLMVQRPRAGRWWVAWSVVWGATSIILWAVFLPPA
ncbi:mannosyltransferase [Trametopsis cervina]|nr:mannosyltransferase [Trametopsis cervina]